MLKAAGETDHSLSQPIPSISAIGVLPYVSDHEPRVRPGLELNGNSPLGVSLP